MKNLGGQPIKTISELSTHVQKTVLKVPSGVIEANSTVNSKNRAKVIKWRSKFLSEFMKHSENCAETT